MDQAVLTTTRPTVGVMKFASCDGCQLTLLDLEDSLLAVAERFDIIEFAEASSSRNPAGPFDVLLVEGSISTEEQLEQIRDLRARSKYLVTIGACAIAGGIQAIRNWSDHDEFRASVYAHPEFIESLATSTPVSQHVQVDAELRGCPIDAGQLVELLTALHVGRRPAIPDEAVCMECKRRGTVCVLVSKNVPCMGPVTHTGCSALCPAYNRGCYACFGPKEHANAASLSRWFAAHGQPEDGVARLFAGFTAYAEPFRDVVTGHGGPPGATPAAPTPAGRGREETR